MTRSQAGSSGQPIFLLTSPFRAEPIKHWPARLSFIFLLAIFLSPVAGVIEPGIANAQGVKHNVRRASDPRYARARSRKPVRGRARRVARPKKSFFGNLFGSKPSTRNRANRNQAKPFQGIKSFFDNIQGKPSPASLRASYEKRMREAARIDAMSANERLPSRSGRASSGWGADPTRTSKVVRPSFGRGKYRTMCVRMCDGYYFPVSFKARSGELETDAQYCNSNCYNAPTKLFYYSNPGGSIENMRALDGSLYKDIANAFKYRKKYVADCRCKAEPWSARAKQQHQSWGLETQARPQEVDGGPNNPLHKSQGEIDMTSASQVTTRPSHGQY